MPASKFLPGLEGRRLNAFDALLLLAPQAPAPKRPEPEPASDSLDPTLLRDLGFAAAAFFAPPAPSLFGALVDEAGDSAASALAAPAPRVAPPAPRALS